MEHFKEKSKVIKAIRAYGIPKYVENWISNPAYPIDGIVCDYHRHTSFNIITNKLDRKFREIEN
jgi:hypothetical protein